MKTKTGVVVKVDKNYVCVRTIHGEFYNLKLQNYVPNIGDIYSGPIATPNSVKHAIFIAVIALLILFGRNIYNCFAPSTTVIVRIPPTLQLKVSNWNRIVSVKPIRSSGRTLIESLNLKNKSLDKGLEMIFNEAKNQDIINQTYIDNNGTITIYISGKNKKNIDLSTFVKYANERKVDCQINYDGTDLLNHKY
ncbi:MULTISPECIES: anti-sigma-I factor RsgI family protein [Clostridium]|uniref:RsgI N-terminal anti-sigma domain-containing protein n=2 Tax=Clostridium TaxID=1485 RepID=A0A151APZ1_9CLOT|nr:MULTISPECIES: anti-sigma factor domain-containing protein [Clostridium]KYH29653.1 hypothetical protein CLCOL_08840 [Clostridium colicanis DSM 13634]MBE6043955.1 anti-sigma factor domain-containing protein [Clostridium thermopalmarium]PRR72104.1 hypothetical protein CPAL_15910 [Clostridium thermopalmarium DSM 5974]PVZ23756.1 anti-sigma factor-like protein [Clostridium thermopalmarium DSM 5974]